MKYRMDDATFQHLTDWCDQFCDEDRAELQREAMVNLLQSMTVDEAEYSLNHGWSHVANLL